MDKNSKDAVQSERMPDPVLCNLTIQKMENGYLMIEQWHWRGKNRERVFMDRAALFAALQEIV